MPALPAWVSDYAGIAGLGQLNYVSLSTACFLFWYFFEDGLIGWLA
tara:strand:+ start:574 stop:711 length:138 start_codon:yes stop_codon:yes gene_type:complete